MIKQTWQIQPSKKDLRNFSLTLGIFSLLLIVVGKIAELPILTILFIIVFILILMGQIFAAWLLIFYRLWMSLAHLLGAIMARIILLMIFYLLFTPLALILKIIKKQPLDLKIEKNNSTYWHPRKKPTSDLTKMY